MMSKFHKTLVAGVMAFSPVLAFADDNSGSDNSEHGGSTS
jgi:hypothetical protein